MVRSFLVKKGIDLSWRTYFITALTYMALGLFSTLIIGLIIQTIGEQLRIPLFEELGSFAMSFMGPAIGAAIAYGLKAPPLVIFAALVAGAAGADASMTVSGEEVSAGPAGAYIAALLTTEVGKLVSKSTRVDIIVTPFISVLTGFLTAKYVGVYIGYLLYGFGGMINWSVEQQPFIMGILVAVLMGLALTAPISSAAIALMLGLEGLAAGAATVGCSAQMVGFATSSYRENGIGGWIAQGVGTSMLQISNIVRNPFILVPPTVTAAILAPVATVFWKLENSAAGAGMGSAGFVGQILTFETMGFSSTILMQVLFLHILAPAVLSLLIAAWMRKRNWIQYGDMRINY